MSGKVRVNRSMSLDGFIAGPGDAMDWIFDFVAPDVAWLTEIAAATGAMLIGRRTYEVGNRMEVGKERGSASRGLGGRCRNRSCGDRVRDYSAGTGSLHDAKLHEHR